MASSADTISPWQLYPRMVRKLSRRKVLRSMIQLQRLDDEMLDSLGWQLQQTAERWSDRPAIKFEGQQWTWAQFNAWCNRYARALQVLGVGDGDVVAIDVTNRPSMLATTMAVLKLGGVAALVNTSLKGNQIAHSLRLVEPRAVVVGEEQLASLETLEGDWAGLTKTWVFVRDSAERSAPEGWVDLDDASASNDERNLAETAMLRLGHPALQLFTSGTTGLPKAAVSSHRKLRMAGLMPGNALLELTPQDTLYCSLPLYHGVGFLTGWSSCVCTGAALAIARRFRASQFWDDIRQCGATSFVYVGETLRYLLNQPTRPNDRHHRVRAIAGAGLRTGLWDEFKERFAIPAIYEVYGASEAPGGFVNLFNLDRTCGWNPKGWKAVAYDADSGEPMHGPDGFMRAVGPGQVGLLIMRIDEHQPFAGYTDVAATDQKILRDVFQEGDLWFNSGDLILNQGHGHIRFVDRIGDTFRWHGENVATTEVEGVINRWHQIEDCIVYGVVMPGAEGRCGMAWLKLRDGEELDREGFAKHLRAGLASYAVPRFIRVGHQDAQVTGTFKHQKVDLQSEGFDLARVDAPLYLLRPADDAWVPFTRELQKSVDSGRERL